MVFISRCGFRVLFWGQARAQLHAETSCFILESVVALGDMKLVGTLLE